MTHGIQYTPLDGLRHDERWQRLTDDPEIRGVEVIRSKSNGPWQWSVTIWVMEFIREDPLETEFRQAMAAELRAVAGVARVRRIERSG
jgi:hypothetical protein